MSANVWSWLEQAPDADSVLGWRQRFGEEYRLLQLLCLSPTSRKAAAVPCPNCSCNHRVVRCSQGLRAVCDCDDAFCPDMAIEDHDLEVWVLDLRRLGMKVAQALNLVPQFAPMPQPRTAQIGHLWSNRVPVILSIRSTESGFRQAAAELLAQISGPFALLAPTAAYCTATTSSLLCRRKACFCDLASHVKVLPNGTAASERSAQELFAQLRPKGEQENGSEAQRVFAVFKQLSRGRGAPKASLHAVFTCIVLEQMSYRQAATRCRCSVGLLANRIVELEKLFGMPMSRLRQLAGPMLEMSTTVKGDREVIASQSNKAGGGADYDEEMFDEED